MNKEIMKSTRNNKGIPNKITKEITVIIRKSFESLFSIIQLNYKVFHRNQNLNQ